VMVAPIDHDDFGIAVSERFCCRNSGEAPANNHDARLIVTKLHNCR